MITVTQRLPSGTQKIYINPDNIERILPWKGGALVNCVGGTETETVETPEQINSKIKE